MIEQVCDTCGKEYFCPDDKEGGDCPIRPCDGELQAQPLKD